MDVVKIESVYDNPSHNKNNQPRHSDTPADESADKDREKESHGGHHDAVTLTDALATALEGTLGHEAQALITRLNDEVKRLREALDIATHREQVLRHHYSHNLHLHCLNRHGLENEYARINAHLEGLGAVALILLSITNLAPIRARSFACYDGARAHAATLIATATADDDIVGTLDGGDFVILSYDAGNVDTLQTRLREHFAHTPYVANGGGDGHSTGDTTPIPLQIRLGKSLIIADEPFGRAIARTDAVMV